MALLSDEEIKERLKGLDGWRQRGESIVKSFDRGDFVGSVEVRRLARRPAEEMDHHPDIAISWSQVEVAISTHSEGGVTENDFELAEKVDASWPSVVR